MTLTINDKKFALGFFLILIAEIIFSSSEKLFSLHYLTKPALMASLLLFFWKNSKHLPSAIRRLTMLALCASVLGDILLMFTHFNQMFFIIGLIAFLLTHVIYIYVFSKNKSPMRKGIPFLLFTIVYACALFYLLKDKLGNLMIPVIIYMATILAMATTAFLRKGHVPSLSFILVFNGAILFMVSDSLLAINKFHDPLPFANISIIVTYAIAQLLIVLGIQKQQLARI